MSAFRYCLCLCVLMSSYCAFSQTSKKVNSGEIIQQAIKLYNTKKYKEIVALYNTVPRNDTNYSIILFNLSLAHYEDSNYVAGKKYAEEGLKYFPEKADEWYNLIANNLDNLGKHAEAISYYDKIISNYHNPYLAWFNKGIVYYDQKQMTEAKKCFQQSLLINPYYAPAHYYLGNVAYNEGNIVAAMLSYVGNLLVNPENKYRSSSVTKLSNIAKVNDEVVKNAALYKSSSTDDFEMVQEILLSKVALDNQYKLKAELEDVIVRQLQVVFEKLSFNNTDKGFWMQYYVPLLEPIFKNEQFEPFVFYIFSGLDIAQVKNYVKRNKKKVDGIIPDVVAYLNDIRSTQVLMGLERKGVSEKVMYSEGKAWGKGKSAGEGDNRVLTGKWEFYYDNGQLKSTGLFNEKQEKTGEWIFYYLNGKLKEKTIYKANKADGKSTAWFDNGLLYSEGVYKADSLDGKYSEYFYNGLPKKVQNYDNGKLQGTATWYTSSGTIDHIANYKDNKEDGEVTYYYSNGKVSSTAGYKRGEATGSFKRFYLDGTLKVEGSFTVGKRTGLWKEYYNSGRLKSSYTYNLDELEGENKEFYDNGKPMVHCAYLKNKLEGKYEDFDFDGKLYSESIYEKGRLKELKFFDKDSKVISTSSSRSGAGNLVFYDANGNKTSDGFFTKDGLRSGKGTFYFRSGTISGVSEYKEGMLNGEKITYFLNGKVAQKQSYKDDEEDGYQVSYYENGNPKHEGEVKEGSYEGLHIYYNEFGQVTSKLNYKDGDLDGFVEYYHPNGKVDYEQRYISGWLIGMTQFDTTGKVISELDFPNGNSAFGFKNYVGKNYVAGTYKNYYIHGEHRIMYADGSPNLLQFYKYGVRDSVVKKNYFGGKLEYEGRYKMGEKDGKWSYYHENGQLSYSEVYNNGRLNGITRLFNDDGTIDRDMPYTEGELDGEYKIYTGNNELAAILNYNNGNLISYTYEDKTGKLVPVIPVKNGTGVVTGYFRNGTKSVEIVFEDDEVNGKRDLYFSNGKPYVEANRLLGNDHGVRKVYYRNGNLKNEENYYYGNLHGLVKKYWDNGKLKSEENWYNGERHGISKNYDYTGKLIQSLSYYYDILQTIN